MASASKDGGRKTSPGQAVVGKDGFRPTIVAFLCNWCAGAGADLAGVSRMKYPSNMVPIRVNCTGRIDPKFIIEALKQGADGVFIGGCHPGDCHYVEGNYKARRRVKLLQTFVEEMGLEPERISLEWVSASEASKFKKVVTEFTDTILKLGPNPLKDEDFPVTITAEGVCK